MILYGKFLTLSDAIEADVVSVVRDFQQQCIDSAAQAIDLIYETFRNETFFQTWYTHKFISVDHLERHAESYSANDRDQLGGTTRLTRCLRSVSFSPLFFIGLRIAQTIRAPYSDK